MNLQQLRFVRETVRRDFNLSEVARMLHTSQPGISRAIIDLEGELGVKIFERHGKRLTGLTRPGVTVSNTIDHIMREVDNLKKVSDEYARRDEGGLVIASTHTQARYLLPGVIPRFREQFPKVRVSLTEGRPRQLAEMVLQGHADLAIATESLALTPGLVTLPCYTWEHTLVLRPDHPLADLTSSAAKKLTLAQLAEYPIITYEPAFAGRTAIDEVFAAQGVHPDIVLEATDADVIKTYVDVGMGRPAPRPQPHRHPGRPPLWHPHHAGRLKGRAVFARLRTDVSGNAGPDAHPRRGAGGDGGGAVISQPAPSPTCGSGANWGSGCTTAMRAASINPHARLLGHAAPFRHLVGNKIAQCVRRHQTRLCAGGGQFGAEIGVAKHLRDLMV